MPILSLRLKNSQDYYNFGNKDYFIYPYYGENTLPGNCKMSLQGISKLKESVINDYIFGQIFVRKFGMVMQFSF